MSENHPSTTATRQLLVLPDRETAEEAAEEAGRRWPGLEDIEVVREALAGEDDAEDAQWLVVLEEPASGWTGELLTRLDELAAEYDGWREES